MTFAQSASSSSAMISGSVVNEPCPISAAGDTMVMVPSVRDGEPDARREWRLGRSGLAAEAARIG